MALLFSYQKIRYPLTKKIMWNRYLKSILKVKVIATLKIFDNKYRIRDGFLI